MVLEGRLREGLAGPGDRCAHRTGGQGAERFVANASYPIDGAVHRVGKDETAWSARDATWSMVIAGIDPNPEKTEALKRWGKAYWEAVHPFNAGGGYVNFMMGDEGESRIKASYGGNFERLVALKSKFDPANLFRVNQDIRPS